METQEDSFKYFSEQFADIMILRYRVPGFEELSLKQKELVYYLYEAALSGREIIYDQYNKHNLKIKRTLEAILKTYSGDRDFEDFDKLMVYLKRVWFSNGIHHHYSAKKIIPGFSKEYFSHLIRNSDKKLLPLCSNQTEDEFIVSLLPLIFDPDVDSQRVNLNPDDDVIISSSNNLYENVTQKEVEDYYRNLISKSDNEPVSYGLNSKLVKENGKIKERIWKVGGMYSAAIERIVYWLEKACHASEDDQQKIVLEKLISFYKSGELKIYDEYNIEWLKESGSAVDFVNGFIEVYCDSMGYRGAYEGIVSIRDNEATERMKKISGHAQWFEDHSAIDDKFKKKNVKGISAKAINVVVEAGDSSPSTPIGINLPNSNWIREKYGSKSVNLSNIVHAYNKVNSGIELREFSYSEKEIELALKYEDIADDLHTDMHEVIGHGSGQILPGVGLPHQTLKNYASTIEEARADLVALYFLPDKKLLDIEVASHLNVSKAGYNKYFRNGLLVQLARIEPGENIEESHMRNRQLICKWAYENGKVDNVIEKKIKNGKTFFVINDYEKLRELFARLLREVQRITSEGDYDAAKNLVEAYGVKADPQLHKEVKERYARLNIAPYKGFINPALRPVYENGKITDVIIEYPDNFTEQMLFYAEKYSFLPVEN